MLIQEVTLLAQIRMEKVLHKMNDLLMLEMLCDLNS
jgi:hypothetical protein